ncbi:endonuclease MutS2 [Campylobacterota bacterium]|nr:endonuclease MutS2 [Campylobacterota bacterium]
MINTKLLRLRKNWTDGLLNTLIKQLDLSEHFANFTSYFAREKPFVLEGDTDLHTHFLAELDALDLPALPKVRLLESAAANLAKQGAIKLYEIYDFVRIARFFEGLKLSFKEGKIGEWAQSIVVPDQLKELNNAFDYDGNLKYEVSAELFRTKAAIEEKKKQSKTEILRICSNTKIAPYLVDRQVHFVHSEETLLVRGGFNNVLSGKVIDRTSAGFFYVAPRQIDDIKKAIEDLENECENIILKIEREFSNKLCNCVKLLRLLDRAYDRFDHYQARINFAKINNFAIINAKNTQQIVIDSFKHPAINEAKSVTLTFDKQIMLITGVNAGGKTMLLKSLLSAVLMAKYLIPMSINPHRSIIGRFKGIEAVIADPQNTKNDISTFAGRMQQFAALLTKNNLLIGVDEIELGTDSDEAASLFRVILTHLTARGSYILVTTHHKRLAALMAANPAVQLVAALYDEARQKPTYTYLQGSIGKSYAFETARRYGVPHTIVQDAIYAHGEDKGKLNDLIERSNELEKSMREKIIELDQQIIDTERQKQALKNERESYDTTINDLCTKLEIEYNQAITAAKNAIKAASEADIHRALNTAHAIKSAITPPQKQAKSEPISVGDSVKYMNSTGIVISITDQKALIETDSKRIYAALNLLRPAPNAAVKIAVKHRAKITVSKPATAGIRLDLHGLYAEEALEKLDIFLSDALISGFDEVIIVHGVGSGRLAYAVKNALRAHPKVIAFADAPAHMGGMGATIVKL